MEEMITFEELNLPKALNKALADLNFTHPTPIQKEAMPVILSGKDVIGIAQTGTGKTLGYMLPILQNLTFSVQIQPRVLIVAPTRELVVQIANRIEDFAKYMTIRVLPIFGGVNIATQREKLLHQGADIIVATPGRLFDLAVSNSLSLKQVKKLIIDEVDVMLDLGFRYQLTNILELLPTKKQSILFSATMTEEVETIIDDFFISPTKISIAVSGTPLKNIHQTCYPVENFYTKINLLKYLLADRSTFKKVLVFVTGKRYADLIHQLLGEKYGDEISVIHSNKAQNYRLRAIEEFDQGQVRILVATDIMARGLDLNQISHVINFDTPHFPENYMHRIGRTGRAEQEGSTILFYTPKEEPSKIQIEELMDYTIPVLDFPKEVIVSTQLTREEKPDDNDMATKNHKLKKLVIGDAFHEKKKKNQKVNLGPSYLSKPKKHKKPKTKGDKNANRRKKR